MLSPLHSTLLASCQPEIKEVSPHFSTYLVNCSIATPNELLVSCNPPPPPPFPVKLMHQIDVLLTARQGESDGRLQALRHQLQLRERDLSLLRVTVQERNVEVGGAGVCVCVQFYIVMCLQVERLKQRYSCLQNDSRARNADCEAQLLRLRSEVTLSPFPLLLSPPPLPSS